MLTVAEVEGKRLTSINDLLGDVSTIPLDFAESLSAVLDKIFLTDWFFQSVENGIRGVGLVILDEEIAFSVPGLDSVQIVVGGGGGLSVFPVEAQVGAASQGAAFSVLLNEVLVGLRISADILRPLKSGTREPDPDATSFLITLGAIDLEFSSESGLMLRQGSTPAQVPPCAIGNTGILMEIGKLRWLTPQSPDLPTNTPAEFTGIFFDDVIAEVPQFSTAVRMDDVFIGSDGFSGIISRPGLKLEWDGSDFTGDLHGELLGFKGGISAMSIQFRENALVGCEMKGDIFVPYFNKRVGLTLGLDGAGGLTATAAMPTSLPPEPDVKPGSPGYLIHIDVADFVSLDVASLSFKVPAGDVPRLGIAGRVAPGAGALDFPPMEITGLWIDARGRIQTEGDGIRLPSRYTVNLHGFQVEVSKLGFGNTEDGGKWIGFSGGVKLVQGMTAGASVEGLRLTWFDDGRGPKISLNGVRVAFEVPNTLKLAGEVSYDDKAKQFRGAVKLDLIALRMQIDATAVFGMKDGSPYLALYLAAEFPAGIPLFATGLGVYGMAGLFAMNMEPNRRPDQPWYALNSQTDWYHEGDPDGVTNLTKWKAVNGSMGFGAGVTLGTLADNGHTFSGKMLLAIVFPGPILLLQGSASLLQERTAVDKDANFSALAVLDGRAGILQLGLDAQYRYDKTNGNLIDIHGGAEGFFNFNDPNAWRLNIGMKDPRERRLTARLFKLFDSYSYVMLDPQQLAMGAWVGFQQQWQFGPLGVGLEAWIDANARVSWKPAHFYGDLSLHGSARLSVFGFSAGLTVDARLAADVFDPLHILGNFRVGIDLPWPLTDISVSVKLEWGPQLTPPPIPLPLKEVTVEHFKTTTSWPLPRTVRGTTPPLLLPNYDRNNDGFFVDTTASPLPATLDHLPVVPLDSRPHVTFARNVNDDALVGVNAQPISPEFERIGDPIRNQGPARVRYGLDEMVLEKLLENLEWKKVARKGTTPNDGGIPTLFGSWAPVPQMPGGGGRNVGQTKLWLWSKTPFEYTMHSGRAWDEWFSDEYTDYPCQTLPGSGWNFENIEPNDNVGREWHHPDEPGLVFGVFTNIMSIKELSRPSHGMTHAFGITGQERADIMLPQPTNLVRVMIPDGRYVRVSDFTGRNEEGQVFGAALAGTEADPYIEITGNDIVRIDYFSEVYKRFPVTKGLGGAIGCAYVPSLSRLIFVEFSGRLSSFDLISNEYKVLGVGYDNPEDVVVTADGNTAYVTERSGTLLRVDLTGNADQANATVIAKGMLAPQQIALDEEGGQAYVVEYDQFKSTGRLLRIDLNGPISDNQTVLAERLDQAVGLLVTNDLTTAYVSEQGSGGKISRIDLATGTSEIIVTRVPAIFMLRWANAEQDTILATQRNPVNVLIRISLKQPEKGPELLLSNLPSLPSSVAMLPDDRYVVCCDEVLTMFSTTLLIPMIVDVGGNVLVRHFEDEFVRWTQAGEVLEPHTTYRLKVVTSMKERGDGKLAGYKRDAKATEYAYFRTDGPPGVARLSAPVGSDANVGKFVTPLDDLSRYVRRTLPAQVAPTPESPVPSRLFYRAYDVGMEFDENYVELMYRLGRRDLSIHIHDSNGAVRDNDGRRLVLSNQWGKAETVTLKEREERWLSVMSTAGCSLIPLGSIAKDTTFSAASVAHLLPPSALCEARLLPALLHDDFAHYVTKVVNGPAGKLERWQVRDDSATPQSRWQIDGQDDPELGQIAPGGSSAIVYANVSELAADHPEQPSNWTDYRLKVAMRFTEGRTAILFRYRNAGEHYRFTMEDGKCQLIRVLAGVPSVLATNDEFDIPGERFVITVEAIGSSLTVYLGRDRLLTATDTKIASGSVGVYSSGNVSAKFSDIYVDDFRNSAPVVYRFSFLSSRFKNFVDQFDSFEDKTWQSTLDPMANVAPLIAAAGTTANPPLDAESRAYDALVVQLPGLVSSTPVVRVTRVEQNGDAIAFLIQSPEPLDWKRININLLRAPLKSNNYSEVSSKVLRKADGSGVIIVSPGPTSSGSFLPPGEYRLIFTYRRDNRVKDQNSEVLSEAGNTSPEEATLDLPWPVQPAKGVEELVEMLALT